MSDVLLTNLITISGLMLAVWLLSLALRDASIVDIAWGMGFVQIAWVSFAMTTSTGPSRWLLVALTTLWGLRLSGYLGWRNHGQPEDKRYATMRDKWGAMFPVVSLLTVFVLQGVVMWIVSLPLQLGIVQSQADWSAWHIAGVAVWGLGLFFEAIGDWQLARFKSMPGNEGQVLDEGLWRYTRHPNYFGDFCVWWGVFIIATAGGAAWWTVVGPIVMSFFLLYVSGVTLLEKDLKAKKPEYANYVERTNAFFPWPPPEPSVADGGPQE